MDTITVNKQKLLDKLQENRAQHEKDYEDARKGYLETALEELDQLAEQFQQGNPVRITSALAVPECHLEDYDRAIQMLGWHLGEEIDLSIEEFTNYVQDKWDWKSSWTVRNSVYLSKVRG
jgi:hypothetical protein